MKNIKVSIIIPTYNRVHLIGETLESVLAQTHQNWECIVVDDGSIDTTAELMEFYSQKDIRIKFYNRPSTKIKGASSCRNYGLEKSNGDYIQFLDSDDILQNSKFEEQLKSIVNKSPLTLVTCKWGSFSHRSNKKFKIKYNSYRNFNRGFELLEIFGKYNEYYPPHVYMISRILIRKTGEWNENLTHNDDGEYFTRLLINTSQVIFCNATAVYYRAGGNERLSILNTEKKILSAIESWNLIENHLKDKYKKNSFVYVRNGKKNIYEQVKNTYPGILINHKEFFNDISPIKRWFRRLISR